jgi:opacity protein-like surface antigen
MKFVVAAILVVFGLVALSRGATAQSTDVVLRRLDALEKKNDALEKENTALRDRMRRLEASKHYPPAASQPTVARSAPLDALAKSDHRLETVANPAFAWTGFYVGAHGGYTSGNFLPPTQNAGLASNVGLTGGSGGVQAGYNYQFAPHWLFGVEQDVSFGNISGSQSQPYPNPTLYPSTQYSGTVRERFGYVWDRVFLYETAGIAWAATQLALAGGSGNNLNISETHWQYGVALGAGMEWAVDSNLSVKLEYLFTYLTKEQYFAASNFTGPVGWPLSTVRAGVNWRFN